MPTVTFISHSPADTESLGAELARTARHGVVIALNGDLGAGKTQWVRGFAKGLGITARVHSPTFTLVNEYAGGRLRLFHLDLYRLESPAQILAAGIDEYLSPDGVAVIEWAQRVFDQQSRPPGLITVSFEIIDSDERKIIYDAPGA
jgi:tRNA threonylcarbamoyladenosine biosynthesis protein TsaE